jgi:NitT/TauT family transport system permease protein
MTLFGYRVPMTASLIVWCIVWELVGQSGVMFLVPPLSSVLAAAVTMVQTQTWQAAALITLHSFVVGIAFAIVVGVTLGVLMGRFKAVDDLFGIWVNIFVSAPLSALVPVLMILFGMGEMTVIVTVFLFAVWIIVLDTRAGIRHVPSSLVEMGRSYGASTFALYGKIVLLAALPEILAGIRLGLVRGVKGVVIGQLLVSIIGYGELFELYSRSFDMENFWALTIILFAAAMLMSAAVEHIEKKVEYYAGVR